MDNENSKDEIITKKETEDVNIENNNKEIIKEDIDKNEDIIKNNEIKEDNDVEIAKENENIVVDENSQAINNTIEPKRIKIPLVGLVLALFIIIIGITVGTIMLLQLNQ